MGIHIALSIFQYLGMKLLQELTYIGCCLELAKEYLSSGTT